MRLRVATWNVYLGAELGRLLAAGSTDRARQVVDVVTQLRGSRHAERAVAVAEVVADAAPDVLVLNEVSRWHVGIGAAVVDGADFELELVGALTYAEAAYEVVCSVERFGGRLAAGPPGEERWATLSVSDVLLVRVDDRHPVHADETADGAYARQLELPAAVGSAPVRRGWLRARVTGDAASVTVIGTHLETIGPDVRAAQAAELAPRVASVAGPVVVVGDLNAPPAAFAGGDLEALGALGLTDAWSAVHGAEPGAVDGATYRPGGLATGEPLRTRLDYVLASGATVSGARLMGVDPACRTAGHPRLWPSDHAGVVADLDL